MCEILWPTITNDQNNKWSWAQLLAGTGTPIFEDHRSLNHFNPMRWIPAIQNTSHNHPIQHFLMSQNFNASSPCNLFIPYYYNTQPGLADLLNQAICSILQGEAVNITNLWSLIPTTSSHQYNHPLAGTKLFFSRFFSIMIGKTYKTLILPSFQQKLANTRSHCPYYKYGKTYFPKFGLNGMENFYKSQKALKKLRNQMCLKSKHNNTKPKFSIVFTTFSSRLLYNNWRFTHPSKKTNDVRVVAYPQKNNSKLWSIPLGLPMPNNNFRQLFFHGQPIHHGKKSLKSWMKRLMIYCFHHLLSVYNGTKSVDIWKMRNRHSNKRRPCIYMIYIRVREQLHL